MCNIRTLEFISITWSKKSANQIVASDFSDIRCYFCTSKLRKTGDTHNFPSHFGLCIDCNVCRLCFLSDREQHEVRHGNSTVANTWLFDIGSRWFGRHGRYRTAETAEVLTATFSLSVFIYTINYTADSWIVSNVFWRLNLNASYQDRTVSSIVCWQ